MKNIKKLINKALNNTVFYFVGGCILMVAIFIGGMAICDKLDRRIESAEVISVERLDEQVVTFETEDGNIFVEYFDYEDVIEPSQQADLTIKEYEDTDPHNDRVVDVEWK